MKTEPYGIFNIENDKISVKQLDETLDRLLDRVKECERGHEAGLWSWQENFGQLKCYLLIMREELKQ